MMTLMMGQMLLLLLALLQAKGGGGQGAAGGMGSLAGASPSGGGGGSGGASGAGSGGGAAAAGGPSGSGGAGGGTASVGAQTGNIVEVPGGRVDASIAGNVREMMAAAKKDGVDLKINSSFRSRAEQERLYAAYKNGTGNLAAKPGTSNHESGLAIDFSNTPGAYAWLAKNAGRFGLKNLPGEPWHYSTTGR